MWCGFDVLGVQTVSSGGCCVVLGMGYDGGVDACLVGAWLCFCVCFVLPCLIVTCESSFCVFVGYLHL
jgi:hypothetical protein